MSLFFSFPFVFSFLSLSTPLHTYLFRSFLPPNRSFYELLFSPESLVINTLSAILLRSDPEERAE